MTDGIEKMDDEYFSILKAKIIFGKHRASINCLGKSKCVTIKL